MTLRSRLLHPLLLVGALWPAAVLANGFNATTFVPEPSIELSRDAAPAPPNAHVRASVRAPRSLKSNAGPLSKFNGIMRTDSVSMLVDGYIQDGWASAVAINPSDPTNCVMGFEEGWDFDPDIPLGALRNGNSTWNSAVFPVGSGIYAGLPAEPWMVAGNTNGEFYTSMVRQDLYPTDNTRMILARSTNNGLSFNKTFELPLTTKQDRPMFDIDRPASLGGASGAHDGKLYMCYDNWGPAGAGYVGSYLEVIVADTVQREVALSGTGAPPFRGTQFQPVAGINDGQILMVSNSILSGGAVVSATFHELNNGGATTAFSKSTLAWSPAGQKLGASTHWGVNGHRIDERGSLALDRSQGPLRGHLYFLTNRNPYPTDPTQDQGDLYLSVSVTRGATWTTAKLPSAEGKTQYFPMMDVDTQGWIHVAFYQNESGNQDAGVLNAGRVDVFYMVSRDGGKSWAPPVRVNELNHVLNMEEPPLGLASLDYGALGDYMQLRATGTGDQSAAYIAWTGYDQYRADDGVGSKKQRVYVTRVSAPAAPAAMPWQTAIAAFAMAAIGAVGLRRRRRTA